MKEAASRLRALTTIARSDKTFWGGKNSYAYNLHLKGNKGPIGVLEVKNKKLVFSDIDKKFRGMGLGKKLYGEVLKRTGTLHPDELQTKEVKGLWKSLRKRYPNIEHGGVKFK